MNSALQLIKPGDKPSGVTIFLRTRRVAFLVFVFDFIKASFVLDSKNFHTHTLPETN